MKLRNMSMVLLAAGLLSACGSAVDDVSDSVGLELGGVASKGRMKRADVKAYEVDADGRKGGSPVASTTTDATDASYALKFNGKKGATYVVEVTANANTREANEISGQDEPLPVGFVMRTAIVAPDATPTSPIQATITPFSEMAVKAAEGASGGFKPANVKQAVTTVSTMLGFDPVSVNLNATSDTSKAKLEDMLKTVSAIAYGATSNSDSGFSLSDQKTALGCGDKSGGEAVKCVVEVLATNASLTEVKYKNAAVNTALVTALTKTVPNSTTASIVVANLLCESGCTSAVPVTSTPVKAAKKFIADLRNTIKADLLALAAESPSSGTSGNDSAVLQAMALENAINASVTPLNLLEKQLSTMTTCLKWWNGGVRSQGDFLEETFADSGMKYGCIVLPNTKLGIGLGLDRRTGPGGKDLRVRQVFTVSKVDGVTDTYAYAFKSGVFEYQDESSPSQHGDSPLPIYSPLSKGDHSAGNGAGTIQASETASGITINMTQAVLPGAFIISSPVSPAEALTGDLNVKVMVVDGTFTTQSVISSPINSPVFGTRTGSLSAEVRIFHRDNQTGQTALPKPNENLVVEMTASADLRYGMVKPKNVIVTKLGWAGDLTQTNVSKIGGALTMSGASLSNGYKPSFVEFKGTLFNSTDGAATFKEFLGGSLTMSETPMANYDYNANPSSDNYSNVKVDLKGFVTAPARPKLDLSLSVQSRNYQNSPTTMTAQFKSVVDSAAKYAFTLSANSETDTVSLNESSTGMAMNWKKGDDTISVLKGTDPVATVNRDSGLVSFNDGTFESL